VRILLSDGSGLTARQCATLLGRRGHHIGVLTPSKVVLTRASRYVRELHLVPRFGPDPVGWADAALAVLDRHGYDVLLPTQEQVAVLSLRAAEVQERGVALATPPFESLRRVQDKLAADGLLDELDIPHPASEVIRTPHQLRALRPPIYVKAPIGTASAGVHLATEQSELDSLADRFDQLDPAGLGGVLAQQPAAGPLLMVQAVFDHGSLVAAHANSRDRAGPGNGATNKTSRSPALIRPHLERLGTALDWHGCLGLDVIDSPTGPLVIDLNPRLVEPGNAMAAGLDLLGAYLDVALGNHPSRRPEARPGVHTHQLMLALLGAPNRGTVLTELARAIIGTGPYAGSIEELAPTRHDPPAALATSALAAALLVQPAWRTHFTGGAVDGYALAALGWQQILAAAS
jgi:hypothetical protein